MLDGVDLGDGAAGSTEAAILGDQAYQTLMKKIIELEEKQQALATDHKADL